LATGSDDRTVRLWDVTDFDRPRQLGQPLTAHTSWVFGVAFSPDGRTLATVSGDLTIILWKLPGSTHYAAMRYKKLVPAPAARLTKRQRGLVAGVLGPILAHPGSESPLANAYLPRATSTIGRDVSTTNRADSALNLGLYCHRFSCIHPPPFRK